MLEYESDETMALHQMEKISNIAKKKWVIHYLEIIHRLGKIKISDCSIAIAVSTSHRLEAYEASKFIIDSIKVTVPIWKKEYFTDKSSKWSDGNPISRINL